MIRLLQSGWMAALVGAVTYGVTTLLLMDPHKIMPQPVDVHGRQSISFKPSWDFYNPEVDFLISELNKEKQALATRAKQLDELAKRLEAERAEINIVTQAVHLMQREFDRSLVRVKEEEQANLKRLAKTYAAMAPDSAASIFKQMEDEQMVKILTFMKENETAPVLEVLAKMGEMEAKRVALITEKLRTILFRPTSTAKSS